jgi:hypothetical protein
VNLGGFPTDSLYKFMALIGTALAALTVVFFYAQRRKLWELMDALNVQLAELNADADATKDYVGDHKDEGERLTFDQMLSVRERQHSLQKALAVMKVKGEIFGRTTNDMKQLMVVGALMFALSTLMAVAGYWLWYTRLQRFQDRAIAAPPPAAVSTR